MQRGAHMKGSCFCGDVRYEIGGPISQETACHCSICRRTTGAPFVAWLTVPRAELRVLQGSPTRFRSSARGTRVFCARCGTQLAFEHSGFPDEIDVTTCSLDDPDLVPPRDHTHTSSRLTWVKLADGLPQHREARP
jgi:hypothetical protein